MPLTAVLGEPRDGRRGAAAGVAAGVLVALSLPPFGWWPLGWIGMAVLAWCLPGRPWRSRVWVGAGFGVADYAIGLLWVQEFSVPGFVAVVLISAAYAVLTVVAVPTARRLSVAVGLPAAFVLGEWARDRFPLGGLPLAGLPLGQAAGPLAPVLRLGGGLGLAAGTVLVGVALAEVLRFFSGRPRAVRGALGPAVAVALAVAGPLAGMASASGAGGHLPPLRVGLVQGGGPRGTRAVNTDPQVVFDRGLRASAGLRDPLDLVVWPEGILQSHSRFQAGADADAVAALARTYHSDFLVGVEQDVGTTRYLNEVVLWDREGRPVDSYVKNHLVPFGEYVPFRSVIQALFNLADVPLDAIPGHGPGVIRTPDGPLAVMISYEVFFDERARGGVRAGGRILVVPTNTASYRSTQVPTQEVAADRMRAWETGRWLIQVTPTGYSTVVSPEGRVMRRTHLDAAQVVQATVARRTGMTVYDRLGDGVPAAMALVAWGAVGLPGLLRRGRVRRRREGAGASPAENDDRYLPA